ncbi:hypothetical protein [Fimbriimonas ginsengisoli]|uniref:Uncharacterized protein n=1 Tax=Fimbriimonas ginsengisoli Gsoil 348 TaxID=661478 RepID=A0A068NV29_FIMGI|nr:hypothetical protein [Fimbriimonas ginsengisoli]AIE86600.1 hypothetical protein OP10G_3232 [Fimbriimonas ginsengisoli Gsoil 348]
MDRKVPDGPRNLRRYIVINSSAHSSIHSDGILQEEALAAIRAAVQRMSGERELSFLVLAHLISDQPGSPEFPFESLYRMVATRAGFLVTDAVRQNRQGYDHLLLLTRSTRHEPENGAHADRESPRVASNTAFGRATVG